MHCIVENWRYGGYPPFIQNWWDGGYPPHIQKLAIWWVSTIYKKLARWWLSTTYSKFGERVGMHCIVENWQYVSTVYSKLARRRLSTAYSKIGHMVGTICSKFSGTVGIHRIFKIWQEGGYALHIVGDWWYGGYPPFIRDWRGGGYPPHIEKLARRWVSTAYSKFGDMVRCLFKISETVGIHRIFKQGNMVGIRHVFKNEGIWWVSTVYSNDGIGGYALHLQICGKTVGIHTPQ